ncbi:MAG: GTP 3',8-cyclase MoaA [Thermodesulfobacteriota bacterium]
MQRTLTDTHNRSLNYLRVSITDRCNLNCIYCRPAGTFNLLSHDDILTYEETLRIIRTGVDLGITKIRITGGEPLVRKGVCGFIGQVAALPGITDMAMTSNGVFLKENLSALKAAGIHRLNISLDTLDPEKFKTITGRDALAAVWESIMTALDQGFSPVKVNAVAMRGINDDELPALAALSLDLPLHMRFIEYMPSERETLKADVQILTAEIKRRVAVGGELIPVERTGSGDTAERFRFPGARGEVGFISPISRHFCRTCNRLRLTADGRLKPCLFSDIAVDLKTPLRQGASDDDLAGLFRQAVLKKPGYSHNEAGKNNALTQVMSAIGG